MEELDQKKKQSIKLAYDQVSKDFGSIFNTLLPGANAKLAAPFGMTILEGVEVIGLQSTYISWRINCYFLGQSLAWWSLEREFN